VVFSNRRLVVDALEVVTVRATTTAQINVAFRSVANVAQVANGLPNDPLLCVANKAYVVDYNANDTRKATPNQRLQKQTFHSNFIHQSRLVSVFELNGDLFQSSS
jgi:hypothetical protein